MRLLISSICCCVAAVYCAELDLSKVDLAKVQIFDPDNPDATFIDFPPVPVDEEQQEVSKLSVKSVEEIFKDDDEVEEVDLNITTSAAESIVDQSEYCYPEIGTGIMSRAKCFSENPLTTIRCGKQTCPFRPSFAVYNRSYVFRVLQDSSPKQSVDAIICKNAGRVCGCRKNCHLCKKKKTCQNVYGWHEHRLIIIVPMLNGSTQYKRVRAKVKVSENCKCVK